MTLQTLAILRAFVDDPLAGWYGLLIAQATGLKSGTVYPLLARLERAAWLESWWEDVDASRAGRPRRRLYRLTGAGQIAARQALADHVALLAPATSVRGRWSH